MKQQFTVMGIRVKAALIAVSVALLVIACGGSGDDTKSGQSVASPAAVTSMSISNPLYSQRATVTVNGTGLNTPFSVTVADCGAVTWVASTSTTTRTGTCTVNAVGTMTATVKGSVAEQTPLGVNYTGSSSTSATLPIYTSGTLATVAKPQVTVVTSMGTYVVELEPTLTPISTNNFLAYVNSGFYTNTVFHRVIANFVVQGGGFTQSGTTTTQKTANAAIALEVGKGLSNIRGSLAMARTSVANSATSQFYVNVANNLSLDTSSGGYAVFGTVVSGMDVIDAIAAVAVNSADLPTTAVTITSATQTK